MALLGHAHAGPGEATTSRSSHPRPHPCRARWASHARSTFEESTMHFQPLADRLLVRRIEEQETVRGGIIIPDTAKEKPQEGEVVAVGPGKLTEEGKRV